MTVKEMAGELLLEAVTCTDEDRVIGGVYIGDLLSWVMGRAGADSIWITIMSNINVVAVAALADCSCVILAEGVTVDKPTMLAAIDKNVNIFSTGMTAYETACRLSRLLQ